MAKVFDYVNVWHFDWASLDTRFTGGTSIDCSNEVVINGQIPLDIGAKQSQSAACKISLTTELLIASARPPAGRAVAAKDYLIRVKVEFLGEESPHSSLSLHR